MKLRWSPALNLSVFLCSCLLLAGCLVAPVPMTKHIRGAAGAPENKNVDLAFLKVGQTTRAQVNTNLSWTDTHMKAENLFVGRWVSSGSGWLWMAGAPYTGNGDAGSLRNWSVHNLVIEFDDQGIVQKVSEVPEAGLVPQLRDWLARTNQPPLDLSSPIEIEIERHHAAGADYIGELVLTQANFALSQGENDKHNFQIAADKISSLTPAGSYSKAEHLSDPSSVGQTIRFSQTTAAGNKITFHLAPADLLVLVKYLRQVQPNALK